MESHSASCLLRIGASDDDSATTLHWRSPVSEDRDRSTAPSTPRTDHPEPATLFEYETSHDDAAAADDASRSIGISADYNDGLIASFLSDIRLGFRTSPEFVDGLRAQEVLAAIQRSLDSQQWELIQMEVRQ